MGRVRLYLKEVYLQPGMWYPPDPVIPALRRRLKQEGRVRVHPGLQSEHLSQKKKKKEGV